MAHSIKDQCEFAASRFAGLKSWRTLATTVSTVEYLIEPWLLSGHLNMVVAHPGVGKSTFGMYLADQIVQMKSTKQNLNTDQQEQTKKSNIRSDPVYTSGCSDSCGDATIAATDEYASYPTACSQENTHCDTDLDSNSDTLDALNSQDNKKNDSDLDSNSGSNSDTFNELNSQDNTFFYSDLDTNSDTFDELNQRSNCRDSYDLNKEIPIILIIDTESGLVLNIARAQEIGINMDTFFDYTPPDNVSFGSDEFFKLVNHILADPDLNIQLVIIDSFRGVLALIFVSSTCV